MIRNKLIEMITNNEEITNKDELIEYISNQLLRRIYIFDDNECEKIEKILKEINYNVTVFSKLLDCGYYIKNVVVKEGKHKIRPTIEFVSTIKYVFDSLGMDISSYNTYAGSSNMTISKCVYSIVHDKGLINNETSFIDVAKKILDNYYKEENANIAAIKVLTILNRINKGFREMDEKYQGVVTSEEFYSLFTVSDKISSLYFSDIIKEFYPRFKNELFVYLKDMVSTMHGESIKTEDAVKYLRNLEETQLIFNNHKNTIKQEVAKIDANVKNEVSKAFLSLIYSVESNDILDNKMKNSIIQNINGVFQEYSSEQEDFLESRLNVFFENCSDYINEIVHLEGEISKDINELIETLLVDSKDFFLEYDSKKFKEIVYFLMENTDIDSKDLKVVAKKCSDIFKNGDVSKLKSIHESLTQFKEFVNHKFGEEKIDNNLFDLILIYNPQFLMRENNIDEIMGILNGELPVKMYGYTGEEISLNKDFLSCEFYKKIKDDNYRLLFSGGGETLASNLNYISMICKKCDIKMKYLNINENLLYSLLSNNLYQEGTSVICNIQDVLSSEHIKFLLENNPELLMLRKEDLNAMTKRSLLNSNSTYNFYDLFFSELYGYRRSEFSGSKNVMNLPFKYYNLGIDTKSLNLDVEEILTSGIITDSDISSIEEKYKKRIIDGKNLKNSIDDFATASESDELLLSSVKNMIMKYHELYDLVPDVNLKNDLCTALYEKNNELSQKISDIEESILEKEQVAESYYSEIKDGELISEELTAILDKLTSDTVKRDVKDIIKKNNAKRIVESKKKIEEINQIKESLIQEEAKLTKECEYLDNALCQVEYLDDVDINCEYISNKSFCLNSRIITKDVGEANDIDLESNVVVFDDSINLDNKDFLNDRDCVDKLIKFLIDPIFSIKSISYMSDNSLNADGVEKYTAKREKLWSRRESRTPVRVYYIPVHTKYYTVYYVVSIDKDSIHNNGGMSDSVYKSYVSSSEKILETVNNMSKEEAIKYAKKASKDYLEITNPLLTRKNRK